jgi:hemophore-related protein
MVARSLNRLVAGVGGLVVSSAVGAGVASADPDLGPVINTTCSYSQVVSALNAQTPAAAAQLNGSPTAQAALRGFLDSSPDQRQQILQELEGRYPQSQQYIPLYAGFAVQVASTCNNY